MFNLFGKSSPSRGPKNCCLNLETLDERAVPANLVVTGTAGADNIYVDTTNPNDVKVFVNNVQQFNPDPNSGGVYAVGPGDHVIINALAGNDTVRVVGNVSAEIHGGDGADYIIGGSGNDVIWGDDGGDLIYGGNGNDVLVGGAGGSRSALEQLFGEAGDDILIGGDMIPGSNNGMDWDYDSFRAVSDAWADPLNPGGAAGAATASPDLFDQTVEKDVVNAVGETNRLNGGTGNDWFFASSTDTVLNFNAVEGDYRTTV